MKDKALEYCTEVYKQYTSAEINNSHGSIIRCWKVGKRAALLNKDSDKCDCGRGDKVFGFDCCQECCAESSY